MTNSSTSLDSSRRFLAESREALAFQFCDQCNGEGYGIGVYQGSDGEPVYKRYECQWCSEADWVFEWLDELIARKWATGYNSIEGYMEVFSTLRGLLRI